MQKATRIIAIIAVIGFIGLIIFNSVSPSKSDYKAWNEQMTLGDKDTAKHHFIMYTDIFCPYCTKFSHAVAENMDEFKKKYIEEQNIYFEVRITDMNYESGHSNNSLPAAKGAYCAAKQEKFWEYYDTIVLELYKDYHSKGIGISRESERIPDLNVEYFYNAAEKGGLDREQFVTCMEGDEVMAELKSNTAKAANFTGGGIPYFQFDNFKTSGFAGNFNTAYDWAQAQALLDAGLSSKK